MNQRRTAIVIIVAVVLFLLVGAVVAGLVIGRIIGAVADREGGIQVRTEQPTSMAELKDRYDINTGSLELNLSKLDLSKGTTDVQARVGGGALTVVVPKGVAVRVDARARNGALSIFGRDSSGEDVERHYAQEGYEQADRRLSLDLSVGTGAISVQRAD